MVFECSYCGSRFEPSGFDECRISPSDETFLLARHDQVFATINIASGERTVCEACFVSNRVAFETPAEIHELHYQFGLEYSQLNQLMRARECFETAISLVRSANTLASLAILLEKTGAIAAAVRLLEEVRHAQTDHPVVVNSLPRLYLKSGQFSDAIAQIDKTTGTFFGFGVFLDRAEALLRLGRHDEVPAAYSKALFIASACCEDCRRDCETRWQAIVY